MKYAAFSLAAWIENGWQGVELPVASY